MKRVSLGIQRGEGGLQGSCASLPLFKMRAVFSLLQKGFRSARFSVCPFIPGTDAAESGHPLWICAHKGSAGRRPAEPHLSQVKNSRECSF